MVFMGFYVFLGHIPLILKQGSCRVSIPNKLWVYEQGLRLIMLENVPGRGWENLLLENYLCQCR